MIERLRGPPLASSRPEARRDPLAPTQRKREGNSITAANQRPRAEPGRAEPISHLFLPQKEGEASRGGSVRAGLATLRVFGIPTHAPIQQGHGLLQGAEWDGL